MEKHLDGFANSCRVKGLIAVLGLASFAWVPSAHAAKLIWTGDFSTGDLSQWNVKGLKGTGASVTYQTQYKRNGIGAAVAVIPATDNTTNTQRAEILSAPRVDFDWDGPEYWLGFSLMWREWDANANTFVQIHAPNEPAGDPCDYAGNTFTISPVGDGGVDGNGIRIDHQFGVRVLDNPSGISSGKGSTSNNKYVFRTATSAFLGEWQDFVVRFKLSTTGNGYYEVWHNGVKVYSEFNLTNVNYKDSCGNLIPSDRRFHNGIHTGIYGGRGQYRRIYVDEFRIAEGTNGYELVDPSGGGSGTVVIMAPPPVPTGLVIETN